MVFDIISKENRCKLIILTGFFGSGKTTLIQYLIKNSNIKIGIIENDLAEINIDGKILNLSDSAIQVISNACICCTGNKHISESVDMLLSTHDNLEYIFIETTGLANPMKLKKSLFGVNIKYQLDLLGTICIVDAKHSLQRQNIEEQILQIAYSDFILVSKNDLVKQETTTKVYTFIKSINQQARINNIHNGKYSIEHLYDFLQSASVDDINYSQPNDFIISLHNKIKTYSYSCELVNPLIAVQNIIDFINNNDIYRCKGIMKFPNSRDLYIFHGVHKEIDLKQETVSQDLFNMTKSSFVFIGKDINEENINQLFNSKLSL